MRRRSTYAVLAAASLFVAAGGCGSKVVDSGVGGESHFSCRTDADCEEYPRMPVCSPLRRVCVTRTELLDELRRVPDGGSDAPDSAPDTGPSGSAGAPADLCDPASVSSCTCSDGRAGTRACNAQGSGFGQCACASCVENQTARCSCADGRPGAATCQGGVFGRCVCASAGDGGAAVATDGPSVSQSCACNADGGFPVSIEFDDRDCICGAGSIPRVGQDISCASSVDEALKAPCSAQNRLVVAGCGMRAVWCFDPLGSSWGLTFDEANGQLVGVTVTDDVPAGACGAHAYRWGRQELALPASACPDDVPCVPTGDPESASGWSCSWDIDAGAVTPCGGADDTSTCSNPGAVCGAFSGEAAPCSLADDPFCDCASGDCICWDLFAGVEPPYSDATATPCSGSEDTATCSDSDARCWSSRPDVSEPCTDFGDVSCDCDDAPCRCWAEPRSRK